MGVLQDENKVIDTFKTLVFDNAVDVGLRSIPYVGPVFSVPFFGPILMYLAQLGAGYVYKALQGVVNFGTILFVNAEHRISFENSSVDLKLVALAKGVTSPEYVKAHADEKAKLKKVIQFSIAQPGLTS